MSDTSVADQGDDSTQDQRPPDQPSAPWRPPQPQQQPSLLARLFDGQNQGVWNRGRDQPTTVGTVIPNARQPQPPQPTPGVPQPAPPRPPLHSEWPPKASSTGPFPTWPPPWKPSPVNAYIPAMPNRSADQWGQPGSFPQEPQPWETFGIFQGVGKSISQWGSGQTQPLAAALQGHSSAWITGYAKGKAELSKMQYQQAQNRALDLENQLQDEMRDYGDAFVAFGGNPESESDNPDKLPNAEKLRADLQALAVQKNDTQMQLALEKGLGTAEQLLRYRDAKWKDLHSANRAQINNNIISDAEAPYKIQPQNPDGTPSSAGTAQPQGWHMGPNGGVIFDQPKSATPTAPTPDSTPPSPSDEGTPPSDGTATPSDGGGAGDGVGTTPDSGAPGAVPGAPGAGGYVPSLPPPDAGPQASAAVPGQPPQAGAGGLPPQGVQVAEAGASDAPPSWLSPSARADIGGQQTAQADTGATQPAFVPQESKAAADAFNSDRINPSAVNQVGLDILHGWKPSADDMKTKPHLMHAGQARALELEQDLGRIQNSKLTGQKVIDALNTVDPTIASTVKGYADGTIPPPRSTAQLRPGLARDLALATKYDPTFTGSTYQTRAGTLRAYTVGTQGQNLVSIATAYSHLKAYKNALEQLKASSLAANLRMRGPGGLYGADKALGGTPQERALIGVLNNEMETSSNEYERGTTGGKPTVSGRDEQMGQMNWRTQDPDVAIANVDNKIALLKARMDMLKTGFTAGVGRQPGEMFRLFDTFAKAGAAQAGSDALGATAVPDPSSGGALRELDHVPAAAPQGSGAPATVQTPDDVRRLPSGTPFIIPSGPHKGETGYAP
jgi:hypothetical protein